MAFSSATGRQAKSWTNAEQAWEKAKKRVEEVGDRMEAVLRVGFRVPGEHASQASDDASQGTGTRGSAGNDASISKSFSRPSWFRSNSKKKEDSKQKQKSIRGNDPSGRGGAAFGSLSERSVGDASLAVRAASAVGASSLAAEGSASSALQDSGQQRAATWQVTDISVQLQCARAVLQFGEAASENSEVFFLLAGRNSRSQLLKKIQDFMAQAVAALPSLLASSNATVVSSSARACCLLSQGRLMDLWCAAAPANILMPLACLLDHTSNQVVCDAACAMTAMLSKMRPPPPAPIPAPQSRHQASKADDDSTSAASQPKGEDSQKQKSAALLKYLGKALGNPSAVPDGSGVPLVCLQPLTLHSSLWEGLQTESQVMDRILSRLQSLPGMGGPHSDSDSASGVLPGNCQEKPEGLGASSFGGSSSSRRSSLRAGSSSSSTICSSGSSSSRSSHSYQQVGARGLSSQWGTHSVAIQMMASRLLRLLLSIIQLWRDQVGPTFIAKRLVTAGGQAGSSWSETLVHLCAHQSCYISSAAMSAVIGAITCCPSLGAWMLLGGSANGGKGPLNIWSVITIHLKQNKCPAAVAAAVSLLPRLTSIPEFCTVHQSPETKAAAAVLVPLLSATRCPPQLQSHAVPSLASSSGTLADLSASLSSLSCTHTGPNPATIVAFQSFPCPAAPAVMASSSFAINLAALQGIVALLRWPGAHHRTLLMQSLAHSLHCKLGHGWQSSVGGKESAKEAGERRELVWSAIEWLGRFSAGDQCLPNGTVAPSPAVSSSKKTAPPSRAPQQPSPMLTADLGCMTANVGGTAPNVGGSAPNVGGTARSPDVVGSMGPAPMLSADATGTLGPTPSLGADGGLAGGPVPPTHKLEPGGEEAASTWENDVFMEGLDVFGSSLGSLIDCTCAAFLGLFCGHSPSSKALLKSTLRQSPDDNLRHTISSHEGYCIARASLAVVRAPSAMMAQRAAATLQMLVIATGSSRGDQSAAAKWHVPDLYGSATWHLQDQWEQSARLLAIAVLAEVEGFREELVNLGVINSVWQLIIDTHPYCISAASSDDDSLEKLLVSVVQGSRESSRDSSLRPLAEGSAAQAFAGGVEVWEGTDRVLVAALQAIDGLLRAHKECAIIGSIGEDLVDEDPSLDLATRALSGLEVVAESEGSGGSLDQRVQLLKSLAWQLEEGRISDMPAGVRWHAAMCLTSFGLYGLSGPVCAALQQYSPGPAGAGDDRFADITFAFPTGQRYPAHGAVVSARCPELIPKSVVEKESEASSDDGVVVKMGAEVDPASFGCILDYVYMGAAMVPAGMEAPVGRLAARCRLAELASLLKKEQPLWGTPVPCADLAGALAGSAERWSDVVVGASHSTTCTGTSGDSDCKPLVEVLRLHRVVLAARCEYLRGLFCSGMRESAIGEIILQIPREALEGLIQYLYRGSNLVAGSETSSTTGSSRLPIEVPQQCEMAAVPSFKGTATSGRDGEVRWGIALAALAQEWMLPGLLNFCSSYIFRNLTLSSAISAFQAAWQANVDVIVEGISALLASHFLRLQFSGQLDALSEEQVALLRSSYVSWKNS